MSLNNLDRTSFLFGVIFSTLIFLVLFFLMDARNSSNLTENTSHQAQSATEPSSQSKHNQDEGLQENDTSFWQVGDSQAIENKTINSGRLMENWQQALRSSLSEDEALTLSELPTQNAANAMSNDPELLTEVLTKIQQLEHSEQRAFLLRAIQDSTPEVRKQASLDLVSSDRVLDRKNGVSLMMAIEEQADKVMLTQYLLQTENNDEVIKFVLAHMSSDTNKDTSTKSFDELQNLIEFTNNPKVKGLALQTMMKIEPSNDDVFDKVTTLINSSEPEESYQGLNILHQQLNDYGKPLSDNQVQSTQEQLNYIANDANQPIDNRIKALYTLQILAEHY